MADNIFEALSKYKKPENYLTASLLLVLEYLWEENPQDCCQILAKFCDVKFSPDEKLWFKTQRYVKAMGEEKKESEKSTLDAEIASYSKCIWIEVKDTAKPDEKQLRKYKQELDKLPFEMKHLVLLSHDRVATKEHYTNVCWYEIYDLLRKKLDSLPELSGSDKGSYYLSTQFLKFLEQRGVPIMVKVEENRLNDGLLHLQSLLNMLEEEVRGRLIPDVPKAGHEISPFYLGDCIGFSFGQNRYWIHIPLDKHRLTDFLLCMDRDKVEKKEHRTIRSQILDEKGLRKDGGDIYDQRSLAPVFRAITKDEQKKILGELLQQMWDKFEEVKGRKYEKHSKKPKRRHR